MTPAARLQAAIEVLDEWRAGDAGLDRVLTRWGRTHRFAGSGDRHAIADLAYDALRRRRSAAWTAGGGDDASGRTLMLGLLLLQGIDPKDFFIGNGHAPAPLGPAERTAAGSLADAPRAVRLDYPDWLEPDLAGVDDQILAALGERAPLDLRVNRLKADPPTAISRLAEDGVTASPGLLSATALRVSAGQRKVQRSRAYLDGLVEIQDAASQAVADIAAARPGEVVIDLCAGGGGKTLALAAAMENRGRLFAHDISAARLAALAPRAERAGARVTLLEPGEFKAVAGAADLVLVDAPCSGSGAWRRNPDAKWRLTPGALAELCAAQSALLDQAATLVRPGGRIVYATCSLLARENAGAVGAFLTRRPEWRATLTRAFTLLDGGDGFYAAVLTAD